MGGGPGGGLGGDEKVTLMRVRVWTERGMVIGCSICFLAF